ncbi:MAG: hypothetical protein ACO1RX_16465 [Candidatus Sericytochromatia bacterium]
MTIAAVSGYNPYASVQAPTAPQVQTSNYSPVVSDNGGGSGFTGDFSSISSMVAHGAGGGFASFKVSGQMAESIKTLFGKGTPAPAPAPDAPPAPAGFGQNLMGGMKGIAVSGLKGAGLSALVSAGVSAVSNGVGVATGKVDSSEAVTNVVKDTIGGAVGGLTAVTAGGLGSLAMGAMKIGGLPATIITVGLGAVGGVFGGQMAKKLTDNF